MNNILIPSFKAVLPTFCQKQLGNHDVAIKIDTEWYLVGELAQKENLLTERMHHGDFGSLEMLLFAKAAVAKLLGIEGKVLTNIVIAAPLKSINQFRANTNSNNLNFDQFRILKEGLKDIIYRDKQTHSPDKTLEIELINGLAINELSAVLEIIPEKYTRYGLIQWGHGDCQVVTVNEGLGIGEPFSGPGLWAAVRNFQRLTNLQPAEAQRAFINGYIVKMSNRISCLNEIRSSIKQYILTDLAGAINTITKTNTKDAIISGGSVHNVVAIELLAKECKSRNLNLHQINHLTNIDPIYTCLEGLKKFANLRLDIGHSAIKASIGEIWMI